MDATTRASALFIAVGVGVAGLVWFRDVLTPFALAVFLWLIMDGFASGLHRASARIIPRPLALAVAVIVVFATSAVVVTVITGSAADFARRSPEYARRMDEVLAQVYVLLHLDMDPPTISRFLARIEIGRFFAQLAGTVQGIASNALFVAIYVVFLFAAQASFPQKMRAIFPDSEDRAQASRIVGRIRDSMQRYLAVQSFVSVLTAVASYFTMAYLGVDNALFWAFLIFLFNYIPTVGSIVATILPSMFALVQFSTLWEPAAVFLGVGFWQFLIGNFLQPRMQGENANLATIVVLLGLVMWGAVWGLPGMFLSTPLTVTVMLILAQFASTRWIAVVMSADGRPDAEPSVKARAQSAE